MSPKELDKALDGWLFSLGWWQQTERGASEQSGMSSTRIDEDVGGKKRSRRFGIDIGVPEQLGFRETKWRSLRQRLGQRRE